jgi:hypothetical protein
MTKEDQVVRCLQYMLDEGFCSLGYSQGEPCVFLETSINDAQEAIKSISGSES